jgi:hypothetical protein
MRQRDARILFLVLLAVLLAACTQIPTLPATIAVPAQRENSVTPTLYTPTAASTTATPTPTHTLTEHPTADAAQTRAAAGSLAQTQTEAAGQTPTSLPPTACPNGICPSETPTVYRWISRTPTLTRTPTLPALFLSIAKPGPLSKVVSPILLEAYAHTGARGSIRVELIGEDGRVMVRKILQISSEAYMSFFLSTKIDFQIATVAEAARLAISVDDEYKRTVALSSVDLILMSMGANERNLAGDGREPFIINKPFAQQVVSGGVVHVEGKVRSFNRQPIIFELITQEGNVVGVKQVFIDPSPDGRHVPFSVDIPYAVTQLRGTRLTMRQEGEHIPGVVALSSIEIWLKP